MNLKTRTLLAGVGRCARLLSLALLPALATEAGQQMAYRGPSGSPTLREPHSDQAPPGHRPYLTAVATPGLRLRESAPAPSYDLEPMAMSPVLPEESTRPQTTASGKERPDIILATPPPKPATETRTKAGEEDIPPILPDDLRREVRPEDVMPYFTYPRAGYFLGIEVPPQPPSIPSSATYKQQ